VSQMASRTGRLCRRLRGGRLGRGRPEALTAAGYPHWPGW
jgi:hypothetical protein